MGRRLRSLAHGGALWLAPLVASPVLLFHATASSLPHGLARTLHNVTPEVLLAQVAWLRARFTMLPVDEWFAEGRPAGTACVTFDDGYRSVFETMLPRLATQGVPATVFVCGSFFSGEGFWRDRVRVLLGSGLAGEFVRSDEAVAAGLAGVAPADLYVATKAPGRNSVTVDSAVTGFLDRRGVDHRATVDALAPTTSHLVDHPLVSYGSHGYRHHVLSSLSDDEVRDEIDENELFLDQLGVRRSQVFSVPFGGTEDIDERAIEHLGSIGCTGLLMSRNRVNNRGGDAPGPVPVGERFLVGPSVDDLPRQVSDLAVRAPAARATRAVLGRTR